MSKDKYLKADHKIIYSRSNETLFGYFAWPSVCKLEDGKLMAAASGFRAGHICPYGKSVCFYSSDEGETWSEPQIVNDSPIDDRDTGLTELGTGRTLLSWFSSDTKKLIESRINTPRAPFLRTDFSIVLNAWDPQTVAANVGSFTRIREASGEWKPVRVSPVTAPHGPIKLRSGKLFYLGCKWSYDINGNSAMNVSNAAAAISDDEGATWKIVGEIPNPETGKFCEPHVVELPNGDLLGALRYEPDFSIYLTRSSDGGATWSKPEFLMNGAPPEFMVHSSGTIIMSYSWRKENPGQRMAFSKDNGKTWSTGWILREDGPVIDLGYPSSVELADGSVYTVYYQRLKKGDLNCALLASRWNIPVF